MTFIKRERNYLFKYEHIDDNDYNEDAHSLRDNSSTITKSTKKVYNNTYNNFSSANNIGILLKKMIKNYCTCIIPRTL